MNISIDQDYLIGTLIDLIKIDSVNPTLVAGGAGEAEIAAFIAGKLRNLNLEVAIHEPEPGRASVVGRLPGRGSGRSLMLNGHIDTVDVKGMAAPFSAEVKDGKIYGRGAYDMKGSVAANITAVKALVEAGVSLGGDVLAAAVADEEYASLGTADVIARYRVDGAIVTEPTELTLCPAHKGFIWLEVETKGQAAHGSRFNEGIDANMRMGRFLAELDRLEQALRTQAGHPLLGPPSLHAAIIEGGSEVSVYAARCRLQIERRTIPGETEAQVSGEIQQIIDKLTGADPTFKATVKPFFVRDPFEVSSEAAIVSAVDQAATKVLGRRPQHAGVPFWADAALLAAAGVETVMIGPIGAGAHAAEEWVDLQSLVDLAQVLAEAAIEYCG